MRMSIPMMVTVQALKQAFVDHKIVPVLAFPTDIEYPSEIDKIVPKIQPITLPSARKAYVFYRFPDFSCFGINHTKLLQVLLMCGCLTTKLRSKDFGRVASWNLFTVPESEILFWRWLNLEPPKDRFKLIYLYISHLPPEDVGQALATQLGSVLSVLYYIQETGDESSWFVKKALEIFEDRRFGFPIRLKKHVFVLEPVYEISQRIPRFPEEILKDTIAVVDAEKKNCFWNTIPKIHLHLVSQLSDSVLGRFYDYLLPKDPAFFEGGDLSDETEGNEGDCQII